MTPLHEKYVHPHPTLESDVCANKGLTAICPVSVC